jgi:polyhydroxybutyrate depolymerase
VILHGRDETPAVIERVTQFQLATGPALLVYPAGVDSSWNAGYCCGQAHALAVDDVAFLQKVITQVLHFEPGSASAPIYLVGYSNGGRMAYRMACAHPRAFAGIAAVEAVSVSSCSTPAPVPVIEVASSGDPLLTIPADGIPKQIAGHAEMTVAALIGQWRATDGCARATATTRYPSAVSTTWAACRPGARVEMVQYDGGTHAWPAGGSGTPSAEQLIWTFFTGHRSGV